MRHKKAGRHFGRNANQRKALLRGVVTTLILHERIETTLAKAKEARAIAERLVTLGVKGDLNSRRVALAGLASRPAVTKLFAEIAPRFHGRNGGYLRIVQTRRRMGDSAPMAVIEFVDYESRREEAAKQSDQEKQKRAGQGKEKTQEKEKKPSGKAKEEKAEEKQ